MTDFYVFGDKTPIVNEDGYTTIEIGESAFTDEVTRGNEQSFMGTLLADMAKDEGRPLTVYKLVPVRDFGAEEDYND